MDVGSVAAATQSVKTGDGKLNLRPGQNVEGVVVSVNEQNIATIKTAGKSITAAVTKDALEVGEKIQLEITEVKGDTVLAKRVNGSETKALHRLGMSMSDENVQNVAELLKNNRPIDRSVLRQMAKNNSEVKMLLDEVSNGAEIESLEEPIRNVLIKIFANKGNGGNTSASVEGKAVSETVQETATAGKETAPAETMNLKGQSGEEVSRELTANKGAVDTESEAGAADLKAEVLNMKADGSQKAVSSGKDGVNQTGTTSSDENPAQSGDLKNAAGNSGAEKLSPQEALKQAIAKASSQNSAEQANAGGNTVNSEANQTNSNTNIVDQNNGNVPNSNTANQNNENIVKSEQSGVETSVSDTVKEVEVPAKSVETSAGNQQESEAASTLNQQENSGASKTSALSGEQSNQKQVLSQKEAAIILLDDNSSTAAKQEAVKTLLQNFSSKENLLLLSNHKTLTLKNIASASIHPRDLADDLVSLSKSVGKHALNNKQVLSDVAKILSSGKSAEDKMAELSKALQSEKTAVYVDASKQMPKQENPNIYYMPVPLMIQGEEERADMYYNKKSKKDGEINILVALNTHKLGEVRCMVNKYKKQYVLAFALENKKYSEVFETQAQELRKQLSHLPFAKNIDILFRSREQLDQDFFGDNKLSDFDVRV